MMSAWLEEKEGYYLVMMMMMILRSFGPEIAFSHARYFGAPERLIISYSVGSKIESILLCIAETYNMLSMLFQYHL